MSSYKFCTNKNGKCIANFPTPIPILYPPKGQVIFGNNVIGPDGWPASRPSQSNQPFTNGISGFKIANGEGPYIKSLTKVNFENNYIIVPNIATYELENNNNKNEYVRTYFIDNSLKYMILARNLKNGDLVKGIGKVKSVEKVLTNRLNTCCLCNTSCTKKI